MTRTRYCPVTAILLRMVEVCFASGAAGACLSQFAVELAVNLHAEELGGTARGLNTIDRNQQQRAAQ